MDGVLSPRKVVYWLFVLVHPHGSYDLECCSLVLDVKLSNYTKTKTFRPFLSRKLVPSQKAIVFQLDLNVIQNTLFYTPSSPA